MKIKKIKAFAKGIVFKNNRVIRLVTEGWQVIWPGEEIEVYETNKQFVTHLDLYSLIQNEDLANALYIVTVTELQIVIQYENGLFRSVLTPGIYAFWKGITNYKFIRADISKLEIDESIDISVIYRTELSPYVRIYAVETYETALLFVNGKLMKPLDPGIYCFWKNPLIITVYKIDTRNTQLDLSGQEIMTRDKASLRINFTLQYRITDILKTVVNKEYEKQLYSIAQLALRELIGMYSLDELLDKRDSISDIVIANINRNAADLGTSVSFCGIRDIIFPGDIKEIMNQVLVAEKKAQANIIMRREETASTRSLLNTARLMEENNMLFRLKEMEYIERISEKLNKITLNGNADLSGQLKQLFIPTK